MIFMQEFRGKRMMGHAFRRCGSKIKVKRKRLGKKKTFFYAVFWTTFFLNIDPVPHVHNFTVRKNLLSDCIFIIIVVFSYGNSRHTVSYLHTR